MIQTKLKGDIPVEIVINHTSEQQKPLSQLESEDGEINQMLGQLMSSVLRKAFQS